MRASLPSFQNNFFRYNIIKFYILSPTQHGCEEKKESRETKSCEETSEAKGSKKEAGEKEGCAPQDEAPPLIRGLEVKPRTIMVRGLFFMQSYVIPAAVGTTQDQFREQNTCARRRVAMCLSHCRR